MTKRIGIGGMGSVYLAEHIALRRPVAIKLLKPEHHKDPDLVERFFREARATAAIRHENIVDILDFGQVPGHAFFVMEALEGRELAELVGEGRRLPWVRLQPIMVQVARALAAAHATGVVHRDMKPGNVFLIERGQTSDFVKVLDFGIAKIEDGRKLTRAGMVFGTAAYMAPEQGSGGEVDGRTDIYALGCMLFEALTGRPPFVGDNPMMVVRDHMISTPPTLAEVAPELSVPAGLEALIAKAMGKFPDERYADMAEFERALAAIHVAPAVEITRMVPGAPASSTGAARRGATWQPAPQHSSLPTLPPRDPGPAKPSNTVAVLAALAHLFVAFTWTTHGALTATELRALGERLRAWAPQLPIEQIAAVLREAAAAYRAAPDDPTRLPGCRATLARELGRPELGRVIADLREIGLADGHFDTAEQRFVDETAVAFGLDPAPKLPALASVYLALAHAADGKIDAEELRVVGEQLQAWSPGSSLAEIGVVLRDAVSEYKRLANPEARLARAAAAADTLRQSMTADTRRRVLADLWRIAGSDGHISAEEQRFIMEMVERFNGPR